MVIGIDTSRAFGEGKTGTENYSYQLVRAILGLPESEQHTFVLFIRPKAILPSWTKKKNVSIRPINCKYLWTQLGLAAATWERFSNPDRREPTIRVRAGLDILWIPAHTLPILRRPGLQTVVTIHGLEYRWLPEYKNWLQRWYLPLSTFYAAKQATRLIAVSESTKCDLQKEVHNISKKIRVILEGVNLSSRAKSRDPSTAVGMTLKKYGIENEKYLLFVGTIQPRKNLPALIEAFSLVHQEFTEVKLVIAGGVGWMAEEVLRSPARLGVQESVVFTGRVSETTLSALYQGAALYVQPSVTEGFGLPVLEAMAAGVPVVTSDGGALPEVVGSAGIVVPLGNSFSQKLATAIKSVLGSSTEQKHLIAMGRERVKSFTWDRAACETLKVLTG